MSDITVGDFKGWASDYEESQAPVDALLRADNLVMDPIGAQVLRPGTRRLGTALDGPVYNICTGYLGGIKNRVVVAGSKIYNNGTLLTTLDGQGEAAIDDYMDSVFVARGEDKFRWDGTRLRSWCPRTPDPPQATPASAAEVQISSFDSGESPGWSAVAGTIANCNDSDGNSNSAKQATPSKNRVSTIRRIFSTAQNYSTPNNYEEDEADMFSIAVFVGDPTRAKELTIDFGVGPEADPFKMDKFSFTLKINGVKLSDLPGARPATGSKFSLIDASLAAKLDAQIKANSTQVNTTTAPTIKDGVDTASDDGWTILAIPRSAFTRSGKRNQYGWNTVKGIRITFKVNKIGGIIRYDNFQILGGAKALFGEYQFKIRKFRTCEGWTELSAPSQPSARIFLALQAATITLSPNELTDMSDPIDGWDGWWVYAFGGALDRFYKIGEILASSSGDGMRLDEFSRMPTTAGLTRTERTRFLGFGFSGPGLPVTGSVTTGISATVYADEANALIQNLYLQPVDPPADDMIDCQHHLDRMFQLTSDLLSYSPVREPSVFLSDKAIRVGSKTEVPVWIRRTDTHLFVGTTKDIIRIEGSGVDFPDGTTDFTPRRLNTSNPPVLGGGVVVDSNVVMYQSEGGWRYIDGNNTPPVNMGSNTLLWRGFERHGIDPVAVNGRHRAAISDGHLYIIVPHGEFTGGTTRAERKRSMRLDEFGIADGGLEDYERTRFTCFGFTNPSGGASNTVWRNRLGSASWERLILPASLNSIHFERDGTLVGGGQNGYLYSLLHPGRADHTEAQADQDISLDDPLTINVRGVAWIPTPWGRNNLTEFQAMVSSDPAAAPIVGGGGIFLDGVLADSFAPVGLNSLGFYRRQFNENPEFRYAQLRFQATAREYNLRGVRLIFLPRPPSQLRYDSGLFLPDGAEDLVWPFQFRFLARLTQDIKADVYVNDQFKETIDIEAREGIQPYEATVAKGTKGYGIRVLLYVPEGESKQEGSPFEIYWFEFAYKKTGNENGMITKRVLPA